MRFIDTHCHILPGVDDGPRDTKTSLEMARIATADGIAAIVATPHITEGVYDGADREERLDKLRLLFLENGIDLRLVAGAEVPMSICASGKPEQLRQLTIGGGNYLLMETAETTLEQLIQALYNVRLCGLYPILAHPERTYFAQQHPEQLAEIIRGDEVFVQVTVAGIEGLFGKTAQRTWQNMARSGMVHLIGTDAHSPRTRAPRLSGSYEELRRIAGDEAAGIIMLENPEKVLTGEKLTSAAGAAGAPGRSLWSRLRRNTGRG